MTGAAREGPLRVALDVLPMVGRPSGAGTACGSLVRALALRPDVRLSGYAVARRAGSARAILPAGVPLSALPLPARVVQAAWRRSDLLRAEQLVGSAEVVHGTNFTVPPSRRLARVVTVNDLAALRFPALCRPASLGYPELVRRAARSGALVHVPSSFVAGEVVELLGLEPERVHVVPWGAPVPGSGSPAPSTEAARNKEAAETWPYVLAVGTVEPRKDYPTLAAAFAELAAADADLRLVIAGEEGWGSGALDEAVAGAGVAGRIVRLGYVSDERLGELLKGAQALAYTSVYEGFGFPPLQAMAAGVPVVATRAGAIPEVVGDAALLAEVGEPASLAGALSAVLGDGELRRRLVARGRERASTFTWSRTAQQMVELYRLALGSLS